MAKMLREFFQKTTVREVRPEVVAGEPEVGRHRADTRERPIGSGEPVTVGAHVRTGTDPSDG